MIKNNFIKLEIIAFVFLIILFFKPIVVLIILKNYSGYPSDYFNTLLILILIPTILEIILIIIPIIGFFKYKSLKLIFFNLIFIFIIGVNLYFSYFVLSKAVP